MRKGFPDLLAKKMKGWLRGKAKRRQVKKWARQKVGKAKQR
jgi:hypothetical protein